jgi:hypothetical protein
MITPGLRVDVGRPPEFTNPNDKCFIKHAALLKDFQQRRASLIRGRHQFILQLLGVIDMSIPARRNEIAVR